ncbi:neuraminidase-like domain-containing protein [Roseiflexus sp.]
MNKITFPLKRQMQGPQVADLQDALKLLLERGLILGQAEGTRRELLAALRPERDRQTYDDVTAKLVSIFQHERGLADPAGRVTGEVDEPTANALNALLKELGVLEGGEAAGLDVRYTVACRLVDARGKPIAGLRVELYDVDPLSPPDRLGEPAVTDDEGLATFRFKRSDFTAHGGEQGPDLFFKVFRDEAPLVYSLPETPNGNNIIRNYRPRREPILLRVERHETLRGRVITELGVPAEQVSLRLYRLDFGGGATLLAETVTTEGGRYALAYDPGPAEPVLEVRALQPDGSEVKLTKPLQGLNAEERANLNLVIPEAVQPQEAEYRRLVRDLTPHVGELRRLAQAKENGERKDITVLHRATGWDARLIALAALTEQLAADREVRLPSEGLYGLLRAGLPSDKLLLAQVEPETVAEALKKVREAGIVALDEAAIADFKKRFAAFSQRVRLNLPVPGSGATYGDMLKVSGLDKQTQKKFAEVFLRHRGDGAQLWQAAKDAGLTDAQIGKLQRQGKLAFLAGNSAVMTERLLRKDLSDPAALVEQDFHRAETWKEEVFAAAGIPPERRANLNEDDRRKLAAAIPAAYAAETVEARLDLYAEDMARKIRLSYPTQVLTRLMETDQTFQPLAGPPTLTLLKNATAQGFRLGETPVAAFLRAKPEVKGNLSDAEFQAAGQELKTLQRLYQITPDNESMPVLRAMGITSADEVTAYEQTQFIAHFQSTYLGIHGKPVPVGVVQLIYRKAQQVSEVTYNLFAVARQMDSNGGVAVVSPPPEVRESVRNELIKHYPTLESLFGSMDFCECEHCRSVLSPAAYFVDLLQFVDIENQMWANFLAQWKATHGGQDYPHKDKNGQPMKPYDVLVERRPDLPHIALTCENTHTALPYIDIVNEILEYYVAHGKLAAEAARDTGEATTAELLAEPQNVIREAYDALVQARYPLGLPFDRWLETARAFCNDFETPLHQILEVFRETGALFDATKPYDRAAIFIDALGLSPTEVTLFIGADPLADDKWHALYGFPALRAAIQSPTNTGNATLSVPNSDAEKLSPGLLCTFFDTSANALASEIKAIAAIGAADSGGAGRTTITLSGVWTTPPDAGDLLVCAVPAMLKSAKALSRRLGVSYKEIAEIVQTGFVSPELQKLVILYKLGVSIRDARFYQDHKSFYDQNKDLIGKERSDLSPADQARFDALANQVPNTTLTGWEVLNEVAGFEQRLQSLAAEFNTTLNALQTAIETMPFDKVLVLADPDAGCNFDLTTLQYADGTPAKALDFLRINLFVRLWRKLGWSIEETDRALTTFIPAAALVHETQLPEWLKTSLIYLAHLKALDEKVKVGKQSRIKLLTLWADIPTTGKEPLYAQLFLTKSVLKTAPVFDHPLGHYLSDGSIKLKDHLVALQGALGLTADDIAAVLADAGKTLDDALSLPNVSLLYRYGLLAKGLKLGVRELIALKQLSGLDPFKPLHNQPLQTLGEDHPFSQTLAFVEAAEAVKGSGLKIEDLDYLLRHRFDPNGKYRPNPAATQALLKTLAEGIRAIRAEHAVPDDPSTLTDEVLQQKLGLVLPAGVVTTFLAMLNGTVEYTAVKSSVAQADSLPPAAFANHPVIRAVTYNATRQEQRLTFRGVLFDAQKNALKAAVNGALSTQEQKNLFAALLDDVQQQARAFFDLHLRKQSGSQPESGFLGNADYDLLFAPTPQGLTEAQQQAHERQRRSRLALTFLPFLQQRLIRQFIVQTLTAQTGADAALVESLVTDERLLQGADGKSLLTAFTAMGERGVSAAFFDSPDGSGPAQAASPIIVSGDTRLKDQEDAAGNPLNAAGSARFDGYLEVATPGAYRFFIELDKRNAEAELRFAHLPEPVFIKGTAANDNDTLGDQAGEFLELQAGVPYRFTLELKNLNGGQARLLVQGETLAKGPLSQLKLYPATTWEMAERAWLLLGKSLQLVQDLGLSERELRYILTHATDFGGVSLSELPTEAVGDSLAEKTATEQRFARFRRLAAYARLKAEMAGGTEDLIGVFKANGTTAPDKLEKQVYPRIANITRREEAVVKATAEALLGTSPVFASEQPLEQLWEALKIVARFGVAPAELKAWTGIVDRTKTADERFAIARDLRDTIKARFEDEAWQRVAQPIFDRLRQQSRDALAAHVMHQHGFARLEQLYEYFLVDPGMEPVVQTSRIRLAIASVQLFIQRCLLNLEPKVHPSTINAKQWEWMKRYRVWEANRKIFLFPENWLEPEFRDDKTHLFTELEGALLQGDVSSDLVEDAFLNYLKKLDELARLDICAMHIEDNLDPARRVLHVFGRTYSQPHKYFYRRYQNQMWTPWEPVTAEIEGDHLAPVVWRDRLYLFWVTFLEKADSSPSTGSATGSKKLTDVTLSEVMTDLKAVVANKQIDVHLHWSEYVNGQWTTRESGGFAPVITRTVPASFKPGDVFIHVSKEPYENGEERGVFVHLSNPIGSAFYLAGRNSAPEEKDYLSPPTNPFPSANAKAATRYQGSGAFKVNFRERITTEPGKSSPSIDHDILGQGGAYTLLPADNELLPMGVSEDAYRNAANPEAVKAAIESGLSEIATLMRPVFYQDNRHTFFVEPSVTEKTIEEWEEWVIKTPQAEPWQPEFPWWKENVVLPELPKKKWPLPDPVGPRVHPDIRIDPVRDRDWLINPATVLKFDETLIGPVGQPGLEVATDLAQPGLGTQINVNPGSEVAGAVTVGAAHTFARSGLQITGGGLNVIGSAGLNPALAQNVKDLNRSGVGAGVPGAIGPIRR